MNEVQVFGASSNETSKSKSAKKLTKAQLPETITKDGTLYRLLNVYFCTEHREIVEQLGTQPTKHAIN
jgi:hypothetical protein